MVFDKSQTPRQAFFKAMLKHSSDDPQQFDQIELEQLKKVEKAIIEAISLEQDLNNIQVMQQFLQINQIIIQSSETRLKYRQRLTKDKKVNQSNCQLIQLTILTILLFILFYLIPSYKQNKQFKYIFFYMKIGINQIAVTIGYVIIMILIFLFIQLVKVMEKRKQINKELNKLIDRMHKIRELGY